VEKKMIKIKEFLQLSTQEIATIVRASGPKVCVFPINGTRRWFLLEHGDETGDDPIAAYMDIASQNHIGLYKLFFDHGIDTLLTPVFGPDLLLRGDEYIQRIGAGGLARLASDPLFLDFYDAYQVRVRFYGAYRKSLRGTPLAFLSELFDQATEQTKIHQRFRLFFGVFAQDATNRIAELAVDYFKKHGRAPQKAALVEGYYGEAIPPVSLFIGFDRLSVFDYPLLNTGAEDLYFTVAPSPYLTAGQLRKILFDHLYTRRHPEPEYTEMSPEEIEALRDFYHLNQDVILGTGELKSGVWIPIIDQG
jgi:tuberculosinol/isotuberculosinol synthase